MKVGDLYNMMHLQQGQIIIVKRAGLERGEVLNKMLPIFYLEGFKVRFRV